MFHSASKAPNAGATDSGHYQVRVIDVLDAVRLLDVGIDDVHERRERHDALVLLAGPALRGISALLQADAERRELRHVERQTLRVQCVDGLLAHALEGQKAAAALTAFRV